VTAARPRRGVFLPIFDELADPRLLGDLGALAEVSGWDGVFVWDHVVYRDPIRSATDPWTAMACIALQTSTVLFGPMVTPLARRRPHVLARQVVALDQLSSGRFVLGVGLGLDASGRELSRFGEELDDRTRAEMLDEALDVVGSLVAGTHVDHRGPHFTAADVTFEPAASHGRVPTWVAARWPNRRPLRRAARHDGLFVIDVDGPDDLADAVAFVREERAGAMDGYDVIVVVPDTDDVTAWTDAGATWTLTGFDPFTVTATVARARIERGPGR
jgi:alkanesulfonate monooxygenase SsuD/methylene tetrahydromethanopterin reductase-like flavin-dependent oxidoreductase (luciferase family)